MQVSKIYEVSRFFKADDVVTPVVRTIAEVTAEAIGNRPQCLVLRFHDEARRLPLNHTNAASCVGAWGDETDDWVGESVEMYRERTEYDGQATYGIRLRLPVAATQTVVPTTAQVPVPQPSAQAQRPAQAQPSARAQRSAPAQPPVPPTATAQSPAQQRTPAKRTNHLRERALQAKRAANRVKAPEADYPSEA